MMSFKYCSRQVLCTTALVLVAGWIAQPQQLEAQVIYQSSPPAGGTIIIQSNQPIQNQGIQSTQIPGQSSGVIQNQPMQGSSSKSVPGPVTGPITGQQSIPSARVTKTEAEWRELLTPMQFYVTRQKGTERAFSGALWNNKAKGTYKCSCCDQPLFDSSTKFESGTGWPSYNRPISPTAITNVVDRTNGMIRTETICSRCDAHLGHVFKDGPAPTGLRYCMNSASLKFEKAAPLKRQAIDPLTGLPIQPTTQPTIQSTTLPGSSIVVPATGSGTINGGTINGGGVIISGQNGSGR